MSAKMTTNDCNNNHPLPGSPCKLCLTKANRNTNQILTVIQKNTGLVPDLELLTSSNHYTYDSLFFLLFKKLHFRDDFYRKNAF